MTNTVDGIRTETAKVLHEVIPAGPVALLDFPNHFNAGDLLIYQGELGYLRRSGVDVNYVCAWNTFDHRVLNKQVPEGTLLLHGGGNFGDRYPYYQNFRETIIEQNKHRTIVQMPQSLEFRDASALDRARRIYEKHPDLTLLMRDSVSFERARKAFASNEVIYCPDSAFGVDGLVAREHPTHAVVFLKRRDSESVHSEEMIPDSLKSAAYRADWKISVADNLKWWPMFLAGAYGHKVPPLRSALHSTWRRMFDRQAQIIVDNAVDILSHGNVVVTDRLHAGVYAMLLGKPVILVDNVSQKISAAYRDYLGDSSDVHLATDFREAESIAAALNR